MFSRFWNTFTHFTSNKGLSSTYTRSTLLWFRASSSTLGESMVIVMWRSGRFRAAYSITRDMWALHRLSIIPSRRAWAGGRLCITFSTSSTCWRMGSARRASSLPGGVRTTCLPSRSKSRTPSSLSRECICTLRADCEYPNSFAALEKLCTSIIFRKLFNSLSSILSTAFFNYEKFSSIKSSLLICFMSTTIVH